MGNGSITMYIVILIGEQNMGFFVLPIFDGVMMDGHPIFSEVDASVAGIHND